MAEITRARELDPVGLPGAVESAAVFYNLRLYDRALASAQRRDEAVRSRASVLWTWRGIVNGRQGRLSAPRWKHSGRRLHLGDYCAGRPAAITCMRWPGRDGAPTRCGTCARSRRRQRRSAVISGDRAIWALAIVSARSNSWRRDSTPGIRCFSTSSWSRISTTDHGRPRSREIVDRHGTAPAAPILITPASNRRLKTGRLELRLSQALASRQSRLTVSAETPSTCAASSTLSPMKTRKLDHLRFALSNACRRLKRFVDEQQVSLRIAGLDCALRAAPAARRRRASARHARGPHPPGCGASGAPRPRRSAPRSSH